MSLTSECKILVIVIFMNKMRRKECETKFKKKYEKKFHKIRTRFFV